MKVNSKGVFLRLVKSVALISLILILGACSSVSSTPTTVSEGIDINAIDFSEGMAINYAMGMSGLSTQATQLLANPNFHTNTDWFNCGPAVNSNISKELSLSGDNACVYQTIAATPDATYSLACFGGTNADYVGVTLSVLDSNWHAIDSSTVSLNTSTSVKATSATSYVAATIYANGETNVSDCILTASNPDPVHPIDPVDPDPIDPDPVDPVDPVVGELLANSTFDTNTDWFNCGNPANANISKGALTLSGDSACVYQTVAATPDATYELVCDSSSSAAFSNVTLNMLDEHYSVIEAKSVLVDDTTAQPSVETSLDSNSKTAYVAVTIYSEGPATHESCSLTNDVVVDSEPTDPEPTDPKTDPEPTDPEPTDPEPTTPAPTPGASVENTLLDNASFTTFESWTNCSASGQQEYGIGTGNFLGGGGESCAFQNVLAEPGATYTLSCDGSSPEGFSSMALSTLDSGWDIIDQNSVEISSKGVYSTSLTATGATYVTVTLYSDTVINLSECGLVAN